MTAAEASEAREAQPAGAERGARRWWPLGALIALAAVLRLSTLGLQSFWYDEAFTPVHVLHASLGATLHSIVHTENTPPLWYLIAWLDARVLGTGEVALRLPSAIAGIAVVPVAWAIGNELSGRCAGLIAAALVAVNPLLVWYSQEARAYSLFVLMAAVAMWCFVRARAQPTRGRMAAFAVAAALALLTHYFAVFLVAPMALWLALDPRTRRAALPAVGALAVLVLALVPLIAAQGGHGTQWIGRWALSNRLQAIPQYYLTGYSGAPLGRGVELLVALPIILAFALGVRQLRAGGDRRNSAGAKLALLLAGCGILLPVALALMGVDYLAPRNLVAAMVPLTVLIALLLVAAGPWRGGVALAGVIAVAFLILSVDVELSPRLQRGDWRGVARALRAGDALRAITTVELGGAPLRYYMPSLRNLPRGRTALVREIDEAGYAPLRRGAGRAPAAGFQLLARLDIDGLVVYRFLSSKPRAVAESRLRRHVITRARGEVLVPLGAPGGAAPLAPAARASVVVR